MRTCFRKAAPCCSSCVARTLVQWPCALHAYGFVTNLLKTSNTSKVATLQGLYRTKRSGTTPAMPIRAMCMSRMGMATLRLQAFAPVRRHGGLDTCAPMKSQSCASLCFSPTPCRWRSFCVRDACTLSAGSPGNVCHDTHFMHCTRVHNASMPCQTSATWTPRSWFSTPRTGGPGS